MREEILNRLFAQRDEQYAEFMRRIVNNIPPQSILGVRTPILRQMAKTIASDEPGNEYFEERQLRAFSINLEKDYARALEKVNDFLPFVDNWATCDQLRLKVFAKHKAELIGEIRKWIASDAMYTVRFGLEMIMNLYLDGDFREEYLDLAASVRSEEYYVNMMQAWVFAEALAKQRDSAIGYITGCRLSPWVHNKAIQKACESFKISEEDKTFLKALKIK